ncbi:MAG: hypothetical protein JOY61_22290 [Chloroflexi bacterium]|nr:hypothetical protein [Chloroflexota bacterium]
MAVVSDDVLSDLLGKAGISFVGTVERIGAATLSDVPVNNRTAVVRVDRVLDAPPSLSHLAHDEVTVLLASDAAPGQQFAFFTDAAVLGKTLAVTEVGRLPASEVAPHVAQARTSTVQPLDPIRRKMDASELRAHAGAAEVVVVGRIIRLEQVGEERYSEHAPHYWRATLQVQHVEKGNVSGEVSFIYPASRDVQWVGAPKPEARQQGLWILHATTGSESSLAPFKLLHADDFRPVQHLDTLREAAN